MIKLVTLVCATGLCAATSGFAADLAVYTGLELEYLNDPDGAGSVDTTTLSGYFEAEYGSLYAGLEGELHEDRSDRELTPYVGMRYTFESGLGYDVYYTQYVYPNQIGADYGELTLSLGQEYGNGSTIAGDVYFYPETGLWSAYLYGTVPIGEKFEGSASFGIYEVDAAPSETEWDIGVSYYATDEIGIDLRYYDGSEYVEGYVGLSISFDTTLFGG
jgi:hypothetical protein